MGGPNPFANLPQPLPQPLPKKVGMDAHVNEMIRRAQDRARAAAANTSQSKDVGNLMKKNADADADASPCLENKSESK